MANRPEMLKVELCLLEFSATKKVKSRLRVDESTESRYNMILGRHLFTVQGLDIKFSKHVIIDDNGPYEGFLAPLVDINEYKFEQLTDKVIKPE